jgi:DNA-binding protein YbaB
MTDTSNKSSTEIEREVESTRAGLEDTLGQLRDRVQPRAVVDEVWEFASGSGGGDFARNLGRSVRDNPIPVVLIGAGLAWLMSGKGTPSFGSSSSYGDEYDDENYTYGARRRVGSSGYSSPYTRRDFETEGYEHYEGDEPGMIDKARGGLRSAGGTISDAAHRAADAVTGAVSTVSDKISGAASSATGAFSGAGSRASEFGGYAGDRAAYLRDRASRMGNQAYRGGASAGRRVGEFADQQPLLVAAMGLAIGAIVGASFRATEAERRLMGEQADRLKAQAAELAHEGYERAASAVQHTFDEVKSEAEAQGLTTQDAKGAVGSLGDRVKAVYEKGKETLADEVQAGASDAEKKVDEASNKTAGAISSPTGGSSNNSPATNI